MEARFYKINKMSQLDTYIISTFYIHMYIILSFDPDTILSLILLCGGGHGASHELMNH